MGRGKSAKNDLKLPVSVCHALYLRNCRSYHQEFWYAGVKYISRCFSLLILYIANIVIVNIKIILFFIDPLQHFFSINTSFSSSSVNVKEKFWGVPCLLHMCVIFNQVTKNLCAKVCAQKPYLSCQYAKIYALYAGNP